MPKNKEQKQAILQDLQEKISKAKSLIFVGFDALGVHDNENLRSKIKAEQGEYYVAKKTLINRALKDQQIDLNTKNLPGKIAAIFSYADEVAPAKVIGAFKKDKEKSDKLSFLGGLLNGQTLSGSEAQALAELPGKQELYSKMVGSLNAPISGFVQVMAGNLRNLVGVLKAISEKK